MCRNKARWTTAATSGSRVLNCCIVGKEDALHCAGTGQSAIYAMRDQEIWSADAAGKVGREIVAGAHQVDKVARGGIVCRNLTVHLEFNAGIYAARTVVPIGDAFLIRKARNRR